MDHKYTVSFNPVRYSTMRSASEAYLLNDVAVMDIIHRTVCSIIELGVQHCPVTSELIDIINLHCQFHNRLDEHLVDVWFDAGYVYTYADISNSAMFVFACAKHLANDVCIGLQLGGIPFNKIHNVATSFTKGVVWIS